MTAARTPVDRGEGASGSVPGDEGTALASVENGEAIAIPSIGLSQCYLAAGGAAGRLVDDLETQDRDWHDVERARFAVNALIGVLAPTNLLPTNPAALKRAFDTGGASVVRGVG